MMKLKNLMFLLVVISDDYGYTSIEHKMYREETKIVKLIKIEMK